MKCSASSNKLALSPQYPLPVVEPSPRCSLHPSTSNGSESIDYHTVGEMKGWAAMTDQVGAGVVGRVAAFGCGEGGRAEGGRVY